VLRNLGREEENVDQVSNFLRCCLRLLNDMDVARNRTWMLGTCMGE
jgi:hypothetical protein